MRKEWQWQHTTNYTSLAFAHAEGQLSPLTIVTTKPFGELFGQRTKWHRTMREVFKRVVDWTIWEYKKCPKKWTWLINTITIEINGMFIFTPVPVRRDVLKKYVHGFMNNDRAK